MAEMRARYHLPRECRRDYRAADLAMHTAFNFEQARNFLMRYPWLNQAAARYFATAICDGLLVDAAMRVLEDFEAARQIGMPYPAALLEGDGLATADEEGELP